MEDKHLQIIKDLIDGAKSTNNYHNPYVMTKLYSIVTECDPKYDLDGDILEWITGLFKR